MSGETSQPVVVRVVASDFILRSGSSAIVRLMARENGTADPFVDLAEGIDLSVYTPGSNVDFDLIAEAEAGVMGLHRVPLFVGVTSSSAAGWTD